MQAQIIQFPSFTHQKDLRSENDDKLTLLMVLFRPYIIDLESANGTFLNNQRIDPRRFYELKEKVRIVLLLSLLYEGPLQEIL